MMRKEFLLLHKYIPRKVHQQYLCQPKVLKKCLKQKMPPPDKQFPLPIRKKTLNASCSKRVEELCYLKIGAPMMRKEEERIDDKTKPLDSEDDEEDGIRRKRRAFDERSSVDSFSSDITVRSDFQSKKKKDKTKKAEKELEKQKPHTNVKATKDTDKQKAIKDPTGSHNKGEKEKTTQSNENDLTKQKSTKLAKKQREMVEQLIKKNKGKIHDKCLPPYAKELGRIRRGDPIKQIEWIVKNSKPKLHIPPPIDRGLVKPLYEKLPRLIQLSRPRQSFEKKKENEGSKRGYNVEYLTELSKPKSVSKKYEDRKEGEEEIEPNKALTYEPTERILNLAKVRDIKNPTHSCFRGLLAQSSKDNINEWAYAVRPEALTYKATKKIIKLAQPKDRPDMNTPNPYAFVVNPKSLNYEITPTMEELAKPKVKTVVDNPWAFTVKPNSLHYKATPGIIALAQPKSSRKPKQHCKDQGYIPRQEANIMINNINKQMNF